VHINPKVGGEGGRTLFKQTQVTIVFAIQHSRKIPTQALRIQRKYFGKSEEVVESRCPYQTTYSG